jgi:hypothetical protein
MRPAVLVEVPADRIQPAVDELDADMVRAARQRRGIGPAIRGTVVNVVVGPVDALLRVAADHMHAPGVRGRPRHLAPRQRQRRAGDPATGTGGFRCGAVEDVLDRGELGLVDAPRLAQLLIKAAVMLGDGGGGQREAAGEDCAASRVHG